MSDCIFCRILSGDAPASFVYRDERCAAFMDLQPVNPGHLLIVPNQHAPYLADLSEDDAAHLLRVAHRLSTPVRRSGLRCEGINLLLADGEAAMQTVFHAHLHLVPRFRGDGFGLRFSPDYAIKPRSELEAAARAICDQLATGAQ